jgi:hypothetical protein
VNCANNVTAITELCAGLKHGRLTTIGCPSLAAEALPKVNHQAINRLAVTAPAPSPLAVALLLWHHWTKASLDFLDP